MATSTKTGRRAYCGLVMDGEIVTSRVRHAAAPAASLTRVVTPGGGVLVFGVTGVLTAGLVDLGVGGRAVTVAVLVGFASSSEPDGQN
jgi:hypothetical protein